MARQTKRTTTKQLASAFFPWHSQKFSISVVWLRVVFRHSKCSWQKWAGNTLNLWSGTLFLPTTDKAYSLRLWSPANGDLWLFDCTLLVSHAESRQCYAPLSSLKCWLKLKNVCRKRNVIVLQSDWENQGVAKRVLHLKVKVSDLETHATVLTQAWMYTGTWYHRNPEHSTRHILSPCSWYLWF